MDSRWGNRIALVVTLSMRVLLSSLVSGVMVEEGWVGSSSGRKLGIDECGEIRDVLRYRQERCDASAHASGFLFDWLGFDR